MVVVFARTRTDERTSQLPGCSCRCSLFEDIYSKDDMDEIMADLLRNTTDTVRRDLEATASMSALVLQQVLETAEEAGMPVSLEMSKTEDAGAQHRCACKFECKACSVDI